MSLVWMEGFDHEASATDLQNGVCVATLGPAQSYANENFQVNISNSNTRFGVGQYATVTSSTFPFVPSVFGFVLPFDSLEFSSGFYGTALRLSEGGTAYFSFFNVPVQLELVSVSLSFSGAYTVFQGSNGGTQLASGTIEGMSSEWNYIEFYVNIDSSNGAFILRANNVEVCNLTSINTTNSTNIYGQTVTSGNVFTGIGCGIYNILYAGPYKADFDDMYFNDTTGVAPYNTFLGDVRIQTAVPNANGTYTQFTPLTGTNWSQVNETVADGDTSYNYSNTVGHKDTFTTPGVEITGTIFGVQITSYARKDDAINRQIANYIISDTTEVQGTPVFMPSSYVYSRDVYIADPATSEPWTATGVNNLQIGYKLIS